MKAIIYLFSSCKVFIEALELVGLYSYCLKCEQYDQTYLFLVSILCNKVTFPDKVTNPEIPVRA